MKIASKAKYILYLHPKYKSKKKESGSHKSSNSIFFSTKGKTSFI